MCHEWGKERVDGTQVAAERGTCIIFWLVKTWDLHLRGKAVARGQNTFCVLHYLRVGRVTLGC